jgi:homoserine O-acetyltransferase
MIAATHHTVPLGTVHAAGGMIPDAHLHVRTWGDPARGATHGWTLVFHALTGSAAVNEWWGPLMAPGQPLDPTHRPVACANLLGGCYGSTGPANWRGEIPFPSLTPRDMAQAHDLVISYLGITRVANAIGGSLGGMVALEYATATTVPVDHLIVIAAPARATARALGWSAAQRFALDAAAGDAAAGLAAARAIAMLTYRGTRGLESRFGNARAESGRWAVEEWLAHHGSALVARFDAGTYRTLLGALDGHELGDLKHAAARTAQRVGRVTGIGISSDVLYPPGTVRAWVRAYRAGGVRAHYRQIESVHGHDGFLMEWDQLSDLLNG